MSEFGLLGPDFRNIKERILKAKVGDLPKILTGLGGEIKSLDEGNSFIDVIVDTINLRDDVIDDDIEYCEPDTITANGLGFYWEKSWTCVAVFKDGRHLHMRYVVGYPPLGSPKIEIESAEIGGAI